MPREIIAPCHPSGEVRSDIGGYYDDDSKDAGCYCVLGECCVDWRNWVIMGTSLAVGGLNKVAELIRQKTNAPITSSGSV